MLADHLCSSKSLIIACLLLGACSANQPDFQLADNDKPIQQSQKQQQDQTTKPVTKPVIRPAMAEYQGGKTHQSDWCTYLKEDAAAEATILRAPTLSGEINDEGRKGVNLGFDLMNIPKSVLIERTAVAKCKRYKATSALNQMILTIPGKLTRAGFAAKARSIKANSRQLRAVKTLAAQELRTGVLDKRQADTLRVKVDMLIAEGKKADSEAASRKSLDYYGNQSLKAASSQLLAAERELADINSDIRTADAFSVNLQSGWRDALVQDGLKVQDDSFYGGVKVSVKLGALNPMRAEHERAALAARLRAHNSEPGSAFWKLREIISAQNAARSGLLASRRQLQRALSTARGLKASLPRNDEAYIASRLEIEIRIIAIKAKLAGVNASLAEIDHSLKRFKSGFSG